MTLKIGNLELKSGVIQSPMAGCTDLAFRLIARKHGMEFAFLEMGSADALVRKIPKTFNLLKSTEEDKPLGAQLVGCNPETMGEAAAIIEDMGFDLLDINFGCPVPKIVSPGGGSALLKEPEKAKSIFNSIVKNVKKIPVTVKMRKGFNDESGQEAIEIAKIAQGEGLKAVSVHGRTRVQGYSGTADWEAIGRIKESVDIPVIGNGDVNSGEDAKQLLKTSHCDGVMLGRGALGNPWIYKNVEAAVKKEGDLYAPSFNERKEVLLEHLKLEMETEGERVAFLKSKRIACWYFKNWSGCTEFRDKINKSQTLQEVFEIIHQYTVPDHVTGPNPGPPPRK